MKQDTRNKAFLIGNGINRAISNGVKSWEDLLGNLSKSFSVDIDLTNEFKPFPLSFEEILFKTHGNFDDNLKRIKTKIAKSFQDTPNNILHEKIMNSGVKHILTTNYDYAFEKVLIPGFKNEIGQLPVSTRETINSIRRRSIFKDKSLSVWHIHGEINDNKNFTSKDNYPSKSIMIGYEHYSEYIGEMQKYIRGEKKKVLQSEFYVRKNMERKTKTSSRSRTQHVHVSEHDRPKPVKHRVHVSEHVKEVQAWDKALNPLL